MATIKEIQARLNFDEARKSIRKLTEEVNDYGDRVKELKKEMRDIDKELNQMIEKKNRFRKELKRGN